MKIAILYQDEYPRNCEVITPRLSSALRAYGHQVVVFCRNQNGSGAESAAEKIVPLVGDKGVWSIWSKLKSLSLPCNLYWLFWLYKRLKENKIDLLIVRDLRLALPALLAARMAKARIICNFIEHYAAMVEWFGKQRPEHWLIRQPKLVELLEFSCARRADHVWVVIEENRERLIGAGVTPEKISVLYNVPDISQNSIRPIMLGSRNADGDLTLVFIGVISKIRCLDRVIEGLARLTDRDLSRIKLKVFGDGDDLPRLRKITQQLKLEGNIEFFGWTRLEEVGEHLKGVGRCIGLIPHYVNELTNHTIPHKLFDYMAMGLPVLATKARPMQRIVEAEGCGWVVEDSSSAFGEAFQQLLHTPSKDFAEAGRRGYQAMLKRYNWSYYIPLVNADVQRVVKGKKH